MTKGRMALRFSVVVGQENCRSLGYARDDKGGRIALPFRVVVSEENRRPAISTKLESSE
jgi:hypothetical protein